MGTISKTVQHRMESVWQWQIRLDELTQLGQGKAADYVNDRVMKYGTAQLQDSTVVKPQTDKTAAAQSRTTLGEDMQTPDVVPRQ